MQGRKGLILALGGLGILLVVVGVIMIAGPRPNRANTVSASTDLTPSPATAEATQAVAETAADDTAAEPTSTATSAATTASSTAAPTRTVLPTASPTITPTPTPTGPTTVNDIPITDIVVMPEAVRDHVREIFAAGQELGRAPHAFSKLGDSTLLNPHFMGPFDEGNYKLGDFAGLQPTIDFFTGSFERYGVATRHGLHSWSVFDPLWADKEWCEPNEHMLACEFRLNNPSVLFVRLGSNDAGAPSGFRKYVRDVVEFSIENGVIPILGTKADRFEGDNANNEIIHAVAAEFNVPLWDFDLVAGTIPNRGLDDDHVHLIETTDPHDYTKPEAFQRGHAMQDLTALLTLYAIRLEMEDTN